MKGCCLIGGCYNIFKRLGREAWSFFVLNKKMRFVWEFQFDKLLYCFYILIGMEVSINKEFENYIKEKAK